MKFTKREQKDIKYHFQTIKKLMEINKIYEDKNIIPKFIKTNLIKYGIYTGRIIEIIHRRIDFKKEENNLNADSLILELYGKDFFDWLSIKNKEFINGNNKNNNTNIINDNINDS